MDEETGLATSQKVFNHLEKIGMVQSITNVEVEKINEPEYTEISFVVQPAFPLEFFNCKMVFDPTYISFVDVDDPPMLGQLEFSFIRNKDF